MRQIASFIEGIWSEEESEQDKALAFAFAATFFFMLVVDICR